MYFKWFKKVSAGLLAITLVFGAQAAIPVSAAADNIEIILTDVTQDDQTTLLGEAKIKVSVKGAGGSVSAAQTALKFSGELKYKSIDFLQGKNNPPQCFHISPNVALANINGEIMPSIVTNNTGSLTFTDDITDLFIITFAGNPGDEVTLSLNAESTAGTYCAVNDDFIETESGAQVSAEATASSEDKEGINAVVKLTMDKVDDFTVSTGNGYADSKITLTITNEDTGSMISTALNTVSTTKGGHYDSRSSVPVFIVENTVISGDTYTVELTGNGYVSYKKTGVDFSKAVEITNADFVPGDINSDGKIDSVDKIAFEEVKSGNYENYEKEYADFNRDGKVNNYDDVFEGIADEGNSGDSSADTDGNGDSENSGNDSSNTDSDSGISGGNDGGNGGGFGGGGVVAGGTTSSAPSEAFTDIAGYNWAKESIYTLKNRGIISGVSATEYAPANNIKRGDFILILTRMLGISDAFTENFADVPQGSYYYNAIGSAKAAGIASGDGQNFMPENTITRQDLITLAYRAFLAKGYIAETDDISSLDMFADKGIISDYALSPMASMVKAGIIQGADGGVNPLGFATRAEVAVMCARLLALMN